ncbi:MAG: toxin-antitoxin system YwqK family antitoxin [Candidatus Thorarchaeota archaeon]
MKILIMLFPILFFITSCSRNDYSRDYTYGGDGLIHDTKTKKLYSGKIIDTTDTFIMEVDVKEGKKNGLYKIYDLKGNKHMQGSMKDNLNEGKWVYFYSNGQVESEGVFINDMAEGRWIFYYPNGIKCEEGDFAKGLRNGKWIFYDTLGNVDSLIVFTD